VHWKTSLKVNECDRSPVGLARSQLPLEGTLIAKRSQHRMLITFMEILRLELVQNSPTQHQNAEEP
jgi:hypothetical protein